MVHYPNQDEMKVALLEAIADRGGSIWFSVHGDELEEELADHFGLTDEQRYHTSPEVKAKGRRSWRNHIQFVRLKCVELGLIDKSVRDKWKLTDDGWYTIGMRPPD